eukprot:TRINITY_DN3101_c0_g1_i1.p2 TRINITY_DN3101_c0_g1~~TRINITY_DN3101_c0_g1_i1.p2  ORF type:complete len:360 (-),score=98.65 TRINITY_DN3101_c0_g1_i1:82-1161(-)
MSGNLRVTLIEATDFKLADGGSSNLYTVMSTGAEYTTDIHRSSVKDKVANRCIWDETFNFLTNDARHVAIALYHKNSILADEMVGRVQIPVGHFADQIEHDEWYRIDGGGKLHLRVHLHEPSQAPAPPQPCVDVIQLGSQQQHQQPQQQYQQGAPQQQFQQQGFQQQQQFQQPPPQQQFQQGYPPQQQQQQQPPQQGGFYPAPPQQPQPSGMFFPAPPADLQAPYGAPQQQQQGYPPQQGFAAPPAYAPSYTAPPYNPSADFQQPFAQQPGGYYPPLSAIPSLAVTCKYPGCNDPGFRDPSTGRVFDYCSKRHAHLAQQQGLVHCALPSCNQPCAQDGGRVYRFCGKRHAKEGAAMGIR